MGFLDKLFGKKESYDVIEDNLAELHGKKQPVNWESAVEQLLAYGFECEANTYFIRYKQVEDLFEKIAELIREGSTELFDYVVFERADKKRMLEKTLNDPKSVAIWKKIFADFRFYYGNYDLSDEERLDEWAGSALEAYGTEVSLSIAYKSRVWTSTEDILDLYGVEFVNDTEDDVYSFVDTALEYLPYDYNLMVDVRIIDGRMLLDIEDLMGKALIAGYPGESLYEAVYNCIDYAKLFLNSKEASIDELWYEKRNLADFYELARKKEYIEAINFANANKIFKGATLDFFNTKLDIYNSFDDDTKNRIESLLSGAPEGILKIFNENEEEAEPKIACHLLNYVPCVFYEDENVFDTDETLYEGNFTMSSVKAENLIVSDVEEDEYGACYPFFNLVGEFEERLMDDEFEDDEFEEEE